MHYLGRPRSRRPIALNKAVDLRWEIGLGVVSLSFMRDAVLTMICWGRSLGETRGVALVFLLILSIFQLLSRTIVNRRRVLVSIAIACQLSRGIRR
jgi:hypothetical protein